MIAASIMKGLKVEIILTFLLQTNVAFFLNQSF